MFRVPMNCLIQSLRRYTLDKRYTIIYIIISIVSNVSIRLVNKFNPLNTNNRQRSYYIYPSVGFDCRKDGKWLDSYPGWPKIRNWIRRKDTCSLPNNYKLCSANVPSILTKAIHTNQVVCRDYVVKPYQKPCREDHDHKNMRLGRPMSPHLTIYAPTVPAMTSIAQRITGASTTFLALVLSGSALFLSNGIDSLISMIQSLNLNSFSILILKIIVGFPFCYHYFCGIRFCLFNMCKIMDRPSVYKTAYQSILAAGVLAVLFAFR